MGCLSFFGCGGSADLPQTNYTHSELPEGKNALTKDHDLVPSISYDYPTPAGPDTISNDDPASSIPDHATAEPKLKEEISTRKPLDPVHDKPAAAPPAARRDDFPWSCPPRYPISAGVKQPELVTPGRRFPEGILVTVETWETSSSSPRHPRVPNLYGDASSAAVNANGSVSAESGTRAFRGRQGRGLVDDEDSEDLAHVNCPGGFRGRAPQIRASSMSAAHGDEALEQLMSPRKAFRDAPSAAVTVQCHQPRRGRCTDTGLASRRPFAGIAKRGTVERDLRTRQTQGW